jgi:hypothetical protein
MNLQVPGSEWLTDIVPWLGGAVGGGAAIKLIEKLLGLVFERARQRDEQADRQAAREDGQDLLMAETLRAQIRDLYARCDILQDRLDRAAERHSAVLGELADLKAENHVIRAREHQMRGYMAVLIGTTQRYHKLLGFPEEEMPKVPTWVNESLPHTPSDRAPKETPS